MVGIRITSSCERLVFIAASLWVVPKEKAGVVRFVDCFCFPTDEPRSTVSEHGSMVASILFDAMA